MDNQTKPPPGTISDSAGDDSSSGVRKVLKYPLVSSTPSKSKVLTYPEAIESKPATEKSSSPVADTSLDGPKLGGIGLLTDTKLPPQYIIWTGVIGVLALSAFLFGRLIFPSTIDATPTDTATLTSTDEVADSIAVTSTDTPTPTRTKIPTKIPSPTVTSTPTKPTATPTSIPPNTSTPIPTATLVPPSLTLPPCNNGPEQGCSYTVQGETISQIAFDVYGDAGLYDDLCVFNKLNDAKCNNPAGETLQLPSRELLLGETAPTVTSN